PRSSRVTAKCCRSCGGSFGARTFFWSGCCRQPRTPTSRPPPPALRPEPRNDPEKEREMTLWIDVCATDEIDPEDVIRLDHGSRTFAVYRGPADDYYCTDGLCTHEQVHLAEGLVMDYVIECPKHNGQFDYRSGAARRAPVCADLATYPVRVEGG